MGSAIAARLMDVGHRVTVYNRTRGKLAPLAAAGAEIAAHPAALVLGTATIITVLTDGASLSAVYEGPRGLLTAAVDGKLFIEMSTVAPDAQMKLAAKVRAKGAMFLECPVGGTVGPARDGKLLGVARGNSADFARGRPILEQLCRRVEHVGPVGAGASLKLALNLPLMVYYQALGESYVLCRHLGLDPQWLMGFLSETSGAANILRVHGGRIAAALQGGDVVPVMFDVNLMRKDLAIMLAEGRKRGGSLPLTEKTLAICDAASEGWGSRDGASLPAYWPSRVGGSRS
jgi:3-hydroxyisobutyrate dehydrogenase